MNLFILGKFTAHSGGILDWKIECDALTFDDIECIAWALSERVGDFGHVEGVPTGGRKLSIAMRKYISKGPLLIVDDVLTTGNSMEEHRRGRFAKGAVIFATSPVSTWIEPLFMLGC